MEEYHSQNQRTSSSRLITGPAEHRRVLHPDHSPGVVTLAQRVKGNWYEDRYRVPELAEVLPVLAGFEDVYLTVGRFKGRRRIAQLLQLGALWADLDYYNRPELAELHPWRVRELALKRLEEAGISEPALTIFSGRGLYLFWFHEPLPRAALPRWAACQKHLCEVLKPLGADSKATDGARVLRVPGTRHGGSKVMVEALTPATEPRSFDQLAGEILPYTREQVRDFRIQKALRRSQEPLTGFRGGAEWFDSAGLWALRLDDLQTLRWLRFMDADMEDYRHRWLYFSGIAMSWLASGPHTMRRELFELAREAGGWSERRTASDLATVIRRTFDAFDGKKLDYRGMQVDPRYRYSSERIIRDLEITEEEQQRMKTLINDDLRRRRHRDHERERRRAAGSMSRDEYEGRAQDRRSEAARLRSEGLNNRQIADALGISKRRVQQLLKEVSEGGEKSVPCIVDVVPPEGGTGSEEGGGQPGTQMSSGEDEEPEKSLRLYGGVAFEDVIESEAEVFEMARAYFGTGQPEKPEQAEKKEPPAAEQLWLTG